MDGSFFAFALIGALVGYIIGDFQRELRYRRETRNSLARAVARTDNDGRTGAGTDADGYIDGPAHYFHSARREARRVAVRGANLRVGAGLPAAGRNFRGADETPVMAGRGWDFDGD